MGVVLNRPSDIDVAEHLPGWTEVVVSPPVVFLGGPVSPNAALCLARVDVRTRRTRAGTPWSARWARSTSTLDPGQAVPGVAEVRIFAGYAGWGPGQLEAEIADGGWFVVDADPSDALSPAARRPLARGPAPPEGHRRPLRRLPARPVHELGSMD